jgi:hypothetical protein
MKSDPISKRGRPFLPEDQRKKQRSIRLLTRHWDKIDAAGKAQFEELLETWQPKPPAKRS